MIRAESLVNAVVTSKVSLKAVIADIDSANRTVLALYGAKSSGITGINACMQLGGCSGPVNFMDDPLNIQHTLSTVPKLLSSHYDCAVDEYNSAISLAPSSYVVVFPIRSSSELVKSSMKEIIQRHHACGSANPCIISNEAFIDAVKSKPLEMRWTSLDCLKFDRLRHSIDVTNARVCFASVKTTNRLIKHLVASSGREYKAMNVDANKKKVFVKVNDTGSACSDQKIDISSRDAESLQISDSSPRSLCTLHISSRFLMVVTCS